MTIKKDLTDIGYLLITPYPKKYRFEGVNYRRAAILTIVGYCAFNVVAGVTFIYGPRVIDKAVDVKDNVKKKLKK
jgi:hypothetical protein